MDIPPVKVRERLAHLAVEWGKDLGPFDVPLILDPKLRLDRPEDLVRLRLPVANHRPGVLTLDAYVRLHSSNENDATEAVRILGEFRTVSRTLSCAIFAVHHARKNGRAENGQARRGSSHC